jgi:transcriptional regulator with XRE-family HTH domain
MTNVSDLHRKWMKSREYRKAYEELAPEFALAHAVIEARVSAGLTQQQLARRMETTQSVVARLESGRTRPSTQTLERLAAATGTRLKISFEPAAGARRNRNEKTANHTSLR